MPLKKDITLVEQKRIALQAAIDCFSAGKWIPKIALADGSSSAEEDAEENDTVNLEEDEEEWQIWQIYESIFIVKIMYINSN